MIVWVVEIFVVKSGWFCHYLILSWFNFLDSDPQSPPLLHSSGFHFGNRDSSPDDNVFNLSKLTSDPTADYDEAYQRSGYHSAGSSAHGSLTSLGMW